MEVDVPVFAGYLNFPSNSGFSLNRISKKKSCQRYCLLYKASKHGIDRLEICESKEDKNPKIITLENCVKITQEPPPANLIQIVKKTGTLTLNALVDEDLKEWINALQAVAFRDKSSTKDFNVVIEEDNDLYCSSFGDGLFLVSLTPTVTSNRCKIEAKTYMLHLTATELQLKLDDDLNIIVENWPYRFIRKYGYRDGKFTFEAGRKCKTGEGTFILNHTNPHEIFRCMSSKMKSMKKLISGESVSNIDCGDNQLSAVASMEAGSRSPMPPSPCNQNINDFDITSNQRCSSVQGFISSSDSLNNCSSSSISSSYIIPQKYSLKNVQVKPQHIHASKLEKITTVISNRIDQNSLTKIDGDDTLKKYSNYESVSITTSADPNKTAGSTVILNPLPFDKVFHLRSPPQLPIRNESAKTTERDYESITAISDAWKTLGVNEVKHSERSVSEMVDECTNSSIPKVSEYRERNFLKDISPVKTTKIVNIDFGEGGHSSDLKDDLNYDRLDFLAPNNQTFGGYKTVVTVSPTTEGDRDCYCPSNNDYELIASPDIQSFRLADDSHIGYGVIRKPVCYSAIQHSNTSMSYSVTGNNNNMESCDNDQTTSQQNFENFDSFSSLDRRNYNGLHYTIVSKPKIV